MGRRHLSQFLAPMLRAPSEQDLNPGKARACLRNRSTSISRRRGLRAMRNMCFRSLTLEATTNTMAVSAPTRIHSANGVINSMVATRDRP